MKRPVSPQEKPKTAAHSNQGGASKAAIVLLLRPLCECFIHLGPLTLRHPNNEAEMDSDKTLYHRTLKLAHENPSLRKHLVPLLREAAAPKYEDYVDKKKREHKTPLSGSVGKEGPQHGAGRRRAGEKQKDQDQAP